MKIEHVRNYREARQELYPSIGDQLDVLWKTLAAIQENGIDVGHEAKAMLQKIEEVKQRCPKLPQGGTLQDAPACGKVDTGNN